MLTMRNNLAPVTLEVMAANTPKKILWKENDQHMILVIQAAEDTDLTVKAGNSIQGVADMTLTVPKGVSLLKLESGRFKNVIGENKGNIVVVSTGTPSIGAVALV